MSVIAQTLITDPSGDLRGSGYIAGTGTGLLKVGGVVAQRPIYCLHATDLTIVCVCESHPNGHWLVPFLDPAREYLIVARDTDKNYEPFTWDYVTPANNLTRQELRDLWSDLA